MRRKQKGRRLEKKYQGMKRDDGQTDKIEKHVNGKTETHKGFQGITQMKTTLHVHIWMLFFNGSVWECINFYTKIQLLPTRQVESVQLDH